MQYIKEKASPSEKKRYQGIIKSIIFSMVETKLHIVFAILLISYYIKNLSYQYIKAVKTIFKYLKDLTS